MPTLDKHPAHRRIKGYVMGDTGTGKTGGLAGAINTGRYEWFIIDLEEGLDPLLAYVKPEYYPLVHYVTIQDQLEVTDSGAKVVGAGLSQVIRKVRNQLEHWYDDPTAVDKDGNNTSKDYGNIWEWGPDRVLVLDSGTALGKAIRRYVWAQNSKELHDISVNRSLWGSSMERQDSLVELLMAGDVKCNILILWHIAYQEGVGDVPEIGKKVSEKKGEEGLMLPMKEERAYPSALGHVLPPQIGRHTNVIVATKLSEDPKTGRPIRVMRFAPTRMIATKVPGDANFPEELPVEEGYAKLFDVFAALPSEPEE